MKNACRTSIVVFLASLVASGILSAQSDLGTISGFIKDPSGASIPNAEVTIKNQTGIERRAMTNEDGLDELRQHSGAQFDAHCVALFEEHLELSEAG